MKKIWEECIDLKWHHIEKAKNIFYWKSRQGAKRLNISALNGKSIIFYGVQFYVISVTRINNFHCANERENEEPAWHPNNSEVVKCLIEAGDWGET